LVGAADLLAKQLYVIISEPTDRTPPGRTCSGGRELVAAEQGRRRHVVLSLEVSLAGGSGRGSCCR
jgi:hypothetical protein